MREKFLRRLPFFTGIGVAVFWGLVYLFLGRLSGMWDMFDQKFPFLIAWLVAAHPGNMAVWQGSLFAMLDGSLLGSIIGFLLRVLFSRK